MRHAYSACASAAVALLSMAAGAQAAPLYHLVDLGSALTPSGINQSDQVSGATGLDSPSVYKDGNWQELEAPPGGSRTTSINGGGSVAGYLEPYPATAIVWKPDGRLVRIPHIDARPMVAYDIADDGTVIGTAGPNPNSVFRWHQGGDLEDLGVPPGGTNAYAFALNKKGSIVGKAIFSGTNYHAYVLSGGGWRDLGTLGGPTSAATDINLKGHVVGCADTDHAGFYHHAFLYANHTMVDIGAPEGATSCAVGIATDDTVAGTWTDDKKQPHAFIYKDGVRYDKLKDITDVGNTWSYNFLDAVNPAGDIVGQGRDPAGQTHVFILKPIAQ
jgi:probable HAF family extracellular repeat protein